MSIILLPYLVILSSSTSLMNLSYFLLILYSLLLSYLPKSLAIHLNWNFFVHPLVPVMTVWYVPSGCRWGVGLQILRLTVNVLNKQSCTVNQNSPPAWMFGVRLKTSYCKNIFVQEHHTGLWNSTDSFEWPWQRKRDMRFGTCNVRSLYGARALQNVSGRSTGSQVESKWYFIIRKLYFIL